MPATLIEPLNYLSQMLDAVTKRLIEILDQHLVFQDQLSLSTLSQHAGLPLKQDVGKVSTRFEYFASGFVYMAELISA